MIPKVIAPLTGLSALITRPQPQAASLVHAIEALGGEPLLLPCIQIEPIIQPAREMAELVIFISVNAVEHGIPMLQRSSGARIAAIGKTTAAALAACGAPADIVPEGDFTSEALLAHPELQMLSGRRVQIVRGVGGREALHEALLARAATVETLEVYRRVRPQPEPAQLDALEAHWAQLGVDVVTVTSVETLQNLQQLLTDAGRRLLFTTPLLVISQRIATAATELGLRGDIVLAGAEERSIIGALCAWHTRARN